jgi:arylsulfatase
MPKSGNSDHPGNWVNKIPSRGVDFNAVMVSAPFGTGVWQLFDVAKEPGEANDLSEFMPEKLEILKTAWTEYANDVGVVPMD